MVKYNSNVQKAIIAINSLINGIDNNFVAIFINGTGNLNIEVVETNSGLKPIL